MSEKNACKAAQKRSVKSIAVLASVLVLVLGVIGGTLAYLATNTAPVVNNFTYGNVPIDIPEDFNGTTKTNVRIQNKGTADAFVRASIVVTWKDKDGNVSSTTPVLGTDYTMDLNTEGWFEKDGYYYCTNRVLAGKESAVLITEAKKTADAKVPEGYDLSIEILAQSVQADGMKNDMPMVEAIGWPVTAAPRNEHPQTIAPKIAK